MSFWQIITDNFSLDMVFHMAHNSAEFWQSFRNIRRQVPTSIPTSYVNPNVRHVGVSKLRSLNATKLRDIDKTLVIQENDKPLAVLLKYDDYLAMQEQMLALIDAQSILSDKNALSTVLSGRTESMSGNSRTIEDVRESLKRNKEKM